MKHFKLAVFGDSFGDRKGPNEGESWYDQLIHTRSWHSNMCLNTAESGVSNWYGYLQLKEAVKSCTIENVIFAFTDIRRVPWEHPAVFGISYFAQQDQKTPFPERYLNFNTWEYDSSNSESSFDVSEFCYAWNQLMYQHGDFAAFLGKVIWNDINKICYDNNIKLIMLNSFDNEGDMTKRFFSNNVVSLEHSHCSIVTGLNRVCMKELQTHIHPDAYMEWNPKGVGDTRCNHLSKQNNAVLSDLLNNILKTDRQIIQDFERCPGLSFDPDIIEPYGKLIIPD